MKKLSALVIAILVSVSSVACGNPEVEEKSQVQQEEAVQEEQKEEVKDEDVTDEYLEQANKNTLEEARDFMEIQLYDLIYSDEYSILDIQLMVDEETNAVVMTIHLSEDEFLYLTYEQWYEIVYAWCEVCYAGRNLLITNGYEDVNFIVLIGDYNLDYPYVGICNGEVFYDITE